MSHLGWGGKPSKWGKLIKSGWDQLHIIPCINIEEIGGVAFACIVFFENQATHIASIACNACGMLHVAIMQVL